MQAQISPIQILLLLSLFSNLQFKWVVDAQVIPAKFDGFVYGNPKKFNPENILIEAFFDPVCPDSRDAWPPLKHVLQHYGHNVSLIVHPFPLPLPEAVTCEPDHCSLMADGDIESDDRYRYHDNAYATSRALHIVDELNSSETYPLWESFFKYQEQFYNKETSNLTRVETVDFIAKFVAKSVDTHYSAVKSGFDDRNTDLKTRVSFKYGCSRGVYGTPAFIVNGFLLSDVGSPVDYNGWKKIIDPLLHSKSRNGNGFSTYYA